MTQPEHISPGLRLEALLAIPERQRTEVEWDEINELEISLTPENREVVQVQDIRRNTSEPVAHLKASRGLRSNKLLKNFHKRSPKTPAPQ